MVSQKKLALVVVMAATFLIYSLYKIFQGNWILHPIALQLGSVEIRWYGLIIAASILIGLWWLRKRSTSMGIGPDRAETLAWWVIIGGIVGARLGYVFQNWDLYSASPLQIFWVWDGGVSIHGALVVGLITVLIQFACHPERSEGSLEILRRFTPQNDNKHVRHNSNMWQWTDLVAPPILLGMILGRFGNLFNYEILGWPTGASWKMFVPDQFRPENFVTQNFFHPFFLYDALLNSILLALVLKIEKQNRFHGETTLQFFAGISVTRFISEFFRIGEVFIGGLTPAQILSAIIFFVSILVLIKTRSRRPNPHQSSS